MATTAYPVGAPEAVELWSRRLAREALKKTYVQRFIGDSSDSLIQIKDETSRGPGSRVTCILLNLLEGDGILGDGTLEGNEESLETFTDNLFIDQLRHAVRSDGKMTEQRIPFSIRDNAMDVLAKWFSDILDTSFMNQIAGNTAQTKLQRTGNNAPIAPDAASAFRADKNKTTDQSLDQGDEMTLSLIDDLLVTAKVRSPQIRPITMNGNEYWCMFLSTEQSRDLQKDVATVGANWQRIHEAALAGGDLTENPIFTGALGMYKNVILHESTRVPRGVNSTTGASVADTSRAILCGAQAAFLAFGQGHSFNNMGWTEELFDYGNQLGVSAALIYGMKKARFNNQDFSTLTLTTFAEGA